MKERAERFASLKYKTMEINLVQNLRQSRNAEMDKYINVYMIELKGVREKFTSLKCKTTNIL